jgi:hypothetical protein
MVDILWIMDRKNKVSGDKHLISRLSAVCSPVFFRRRIFAAVMSAVFAVAFVMYQFLWANADVSWYLYATPKYLEGARLYVDIIEVNPPLAFFIVVPPAFIAMTADLDILVVFYIYVFFLIAVSLYLSGQLLGSITSFPDHQRRATILAAALALLYLPSTAVGEREHFLVIFALPYILLIAGRLAKAEYSRWLAITVGCFSFFGFGLKPYFLIAPLLLEVYILFGKRNLKALFRPENLSLGAMLFGYLAVIYFYTPEYLSRIVPYALEVYSGIYISPWYEVIWTAFLPLMILLLFLLTPDKIHGPRAVATALIIAGTGFLAAYVYQQANWYYRVYPAIACLFTGLAVMFAQHAKFIRMFNGFRDLKAAWPTTWSILTVTTLAAFAITMPLQVGSNLYVSHGITDDATDYEELLKRLEPYRSKAIFIFTPNMSNNFPLVNYLDVHWSSRFPALWMFGGAVEARRQISQGTKRNVTIIDEIERYNIDAVVSDLLAYPPDVIIINTAIGPIVNQAGGEKSYDYISYFSADERFPEFWRNYQKSHSAKRYDLYTRSP